MKHCPCRRTLLQGQQHMNQSFLFSVVDVYLFPTCSLLMSRENTFSPPKMWWVLPFRLIVQREEKFRRHQRRQQSQWKRRKWGVNVELRQKCVCSKWERFILSKKTCGCPDDYECTMKRTRKAWKREGQKKKENWTSCMCELSHMHGRTDCQTGNTSTGCLWPKDINCENSPAVTFVQIKQNENPLGVISACSCDGALSWKKKKEKREHRETLQAKISLLCSRCALLIYPVANMLEKKGKLSSCMDQPYTAFQ